MTFVTLKALIFLLIKKGIITKEELDSNIRDIKFEEWVERRRESGVK